MINLLDNIKDKKRIKILLKVIERVYMKNTDKQKLIDESMIDISKEECVPSEQDFFFFFAVSFIVMEYISIKFLCAKDSL